MKLLQFCVCDLHSFSVLHVHQASLLLLFQESSLSLERIHSYALPKIPLTLLNKNWSTQAGCQTVLNPRLQEGKSHDLKLSHYSHFLNKQNKNINLHRKVDVREMGNK